ncbi:MAG TPA: ATP-dependent zinc metalloprotease FtsH [Pyrinomonadaceae bacterium]|jgi:cell division protease FtsH|nr:ATP-dependent zinc metalloprotease FtsH [Pyrinomonadaceae bacterium]
MPSPIRKIVSSSARVTLILAAMTATLLIVATLLIAYQSRAPRVSKINYSELYQIAETGSALSLTIESDTLTVAGKEGVSLQATVTSDAIRQGLVEQFRKHNVPIEFRPVEPSWATTVLTWGAPLLTVLFLGFIGWRVYTSMNGGVGSFTVPNQNGKQEVSFADVAGVDEATAELSETIDFLRDPARFGRLGGRVPRGILLYGPPGTGKTLLARAVAGEAGVPFLLASGSSFQEKFAGVGASRVRRLFAEGKKVAPCIIFIDEIDALGRQRGRGNDSATADQDQTLNQLLIEMDGFDQSSSIVVIGSTNRPDVLDRALTRPGRFDREIAVNLPDVRGREAILRVHARRMRLDPDLDLTWVARGTPGFSGADLANLLNEAAIAATRDNSEAVGRPHIEYARDRILMGAERHGFMIDEDERYATAVHEAGHVAVGLEVKNGDPIHKVSILPRGRALGVTQSLPERDRLMKKREYLEDQIAVLLGGRAAEQVLLSTMTAGASNDIQRAVEIARSMVSEFGMSPLGPIYLGDPTREPLSQSLLDRVEEAVNNIINTQLARACEVVTEERDSIARLVELLLEHDTVEADGIEQCFAPAAPLALRPAPSLLQPGA